MRPQLDFNIFIAAFTLSEVEGSLSMERNEK